MNDYTSRLEAAQKRLAKLNAMKSVLTEQKKKSEGKLAELCGGKKKDIKIKELTKQKKELEAEIEKSLDLIEKQLGEING